MEKYPQGLPKRQRVLAGRRIRRNVCRLTSSSSARGLALSAEGGHDSIQYLEAIWPWAIPSTFNSREIDDVPVHCFSGRGRN